MSRYDTDHDYHRTTKDWYRILSKMSQSELAALRRFAPPGHVVFTHDGLTEHFNKCFKARGGMTQEISKMIGWGRP